MATIKVKRFFRFFSQFSFSLLVKFSERLSTNQSECFHSRKLKALTKTISYLKKKKTQIGSNTRFGLSLEKSVVCFGTPLGTFRQT